MYPSFLPTLNTGTGAERMIVVIKWPELVTWLPSVKYGH